MYVAKPKYLRRLTSHEIAVTNKLIKRSRAALTPSPQPCGAVKAAEQRPRTRGLRPSFTSASLRIPAHVDLVEGSDHAALLGELDQAHR